MDIGTFRGLVTAVLMALFVGLVIWAYSRGRRAEYTRAAALPLEDDAAPPRTET
jgi:cytochrome c oxidase cbb3-type subunit 4